MDRKYAFNSRLEKECANPSEEINCMNCRMKQDTLFNDLSFEELSILNKERYRVSFKAGETLCKMGCKPIGLLCLNSGKAKLINPGFNGVEQIIGLKKPMDFIGLRSVVLDCQSPVSAIALEDTTACVIERKYLYHVLKNNNRLAFKFMRYFARQLEQAEHRYTSNTQKNMRARLADALLHLLETYGTQKDNLTIDISLKRIEIASLSNMSQANAIRFLSTFSKEGLIEMEGRKITIKDLKALQAASNQDW